MASSDHPAHGLPLPEPRADGTFPTKTAEDLARLLRMSFQKAQDALDEEVFSGNMLFPTDIGEAYQAAFEKSVRIAELYAHLVWSPADRVHYRVSPGDLDWKYIAGGERAQK